MQSFKKWTTVAVTAALMASVLAGCGSTKDSSSTASNTGGTAPATQPEGKKGVALTVWSHLTEDEVNALKPIAEEWAKKTGNTVTVMLDPGDMNAFPQVAASGKGPDVMFGLAHDNMGGAYKAGLLAEVPANLVNKADYVPASLDAVSFDGKMYGLPVAMETYALFYRTDKIKAAPKTWDEFTAAAKANGFVYDITNFYFSWGFMQGEGGYVFKNNAGALDPKDIGLANDGAVKGLQLISDFVNKDHYMAADITGDIAKGKFQAGDAAMYLSGPWDVGGFKSANVPFAVAPMPALPDGKKFSGFEGIQASFVNAMSKHQTEAWDLLKYLDEHAALPLFKINNRIPVLKSALSSDEVKSNTIMAGFAAAAQDAVPMPNIAAMGTVWDPMKAAITLTITNQSGAKEAADGAVAKIKDAIAQQK